MALDERCLEEQRLAHVVDHRVLDVGYAIHRLFDSQRLLRPAAGLPVLAHAVAEILGLAHVQDSATIVLEEVDARVLGQLGEGRSELWSHLSSIVTPLTEAAPPFDGAALSSCGRWVWASLSRPGF